MEKTREASLVFYGEGKEDTAQLKRKRNSSPLSYVAVIASAILSSPRQRLPLSEIYRFIEERHPEFTENRARWKNTVRHNLSLHDCFLRGEVAFNRKGCNWRIHPSFLAEFSRGDFSRHKLSQSPPICWESAYQTLYATQLARNPAPTCYICEPSHHHIPSPGWLPRPFAQRQEIQYPHIPQRALAVPDLLNVYV